MLTITNRTATKLTVVTETPSARAARHRVCRAVFATGAPARARPGSPAGRAARSPCRSRRGPRDPDTRALTSTTRAVNSANGKGETAGQRNHGVMGSSCAGYLGVGNRNLNHECTAATQRIVPRVSSRPRPGWVPARGCGPHATRPARGALAPASRDTRPRRENKMLTDSRSDQTITSGCVVGSTDFRRASGAHGPHMLRSVQTVPHGPPHSIFAGKRAPAL